MFFFHFVFICYGFLPKALPTALAADLGNFSTWPASGRGVCVFFCVYLGMFICLFIYIYMYIDLGIFNIYLFKYVLYRIFCCFDFIDH